MRQGHQRFSFRSFSQSPSSADQSFPSLVAEELQMLWRMRTRCVHSAAFVWQREFYRSAVHCNRSSPKFASRRSEHRMLLFINRLRPEGLGSGVVVLSARCRAKAVVTWRSKGGSRSGVTRLSSFLTDHPR